MIRGYFSSEGFRRRPFIDAVFQFPTLDNLRYETPLLVDTGADRTILSPSAGLQLVERFNVDLDDLDAGAPSIGVGGQVNTRTVETEINLQGVTIQLTVTIIDPPLDGEPLPIPSLLGRDIISRFGLFVDQRTEQVLLLEDDEVDALHLPSQH